MIYQFQNVRGFKKRKLQKSDIVLIEADENYSKFYLNTGKQFTLAKTLKECEGIFFDPNFVRSHRKFIVNVDYCKNILPNTVELSCNLTAKVSRRKRKYLIQETLASESSQILTP